MVNTGGEGVLAKPVVLLEVIKGGEMGGLELFLRRENRKNLRYFRMVPNKNNSIN